MHKITGTMIAGICGLSRHETIEDVWLKAKELVSATETEAMKIGIFLEPYLRKKLASILKTKIMPKYIEKDIFAGHLDGITRDAVVEFKTTQKLNGLAVEWNCQVQWYMMLANRSKSLVYVAEVSPLPLEQIKILVNKKIFEKFAKMELYQVDKDEAFIEFAKQRAIWFHSLLQKDELPDGFNVEPEILFPKGSGAIVATEDVVQICDEYRQTKKQIREAEKRLDEIRKKIQNFMRNNEEVHYKGSVIATWKNQVRNLIDSEKLKEENPEIYEKYKKVVNSRVFNVKL